MGQNNFFKQYMKHMTYSFIFSIYPLKKSWIFWMENCEYSWVCHGLLENDYCLLGHE